VLTVGAKTLRIAVHVQPRSSRAEVAGRHGGALKVRVTAAPADGAANRELLAVLARWLGLGRHALAIVHGRSGRQKLVEVTTDDPAQLTLRIERALAACVDNPGAAD
jgi:uncharacterized protein (TIGR00251 family)